MVINESYILQYVQLNKNILRTIQQHSIVFMLSTIRIIKPSTMFIRKRLACYCYPQVPLLFVVDLHKEKVMLYK